MINNEARKHAAIAMGRALIAASAAHPMPERPGERQRDATVASGEWLGRNVGLGLFEGGRAEGFNLMQIMTGMGEAVGELLRGENPLMMEVVIEEFDRGVARGAGVAFQERPR